MNKTRLRQFLAFFLLLCMLCGTTLPISAEVSTGEMMPTETSVSVATPENATSDGSTEKADSSGTSSLASATAETALSEAAQAFVDAVAALDREGILTAINAWGLASQAWQTDQSNAELTAALEAATEASDAAAAPVYAAEDLYLALSDKEREIDAVKAAYSSLTALVISMQLAMQNPVAPGGGGDEPDLEEIATVLYGDLPDAPTGSYMGEYGLPVATGDTKISISAWKHDLLDASSKGRLDADALNEAHAVMAVAKQDGVDYAIVPIAVQVEYPANGATTTVTLPDSVELLSYTSTAENLVVASEKERAQVLNASYKDSSASASGFYVKATEDFSVTFTYSAPDGTTINKKLDVSINGSAEAAVLPTSNSNGVSTYANTPTPPFTTGKITKIEYVVSTWLVWFNGVEAYCCDNGLYAAPGGCPTYSFAYVSTLGADQYVPGNHYANQINIWGGLNQISLGLLSKSHDVNDFASSSFAANTTTAYSTTSNDVLKTAYEYYNDTQLWIIEHYPNSVAAQSYMKSAAALENNGLDARPYLGNGGYYTFAYFPPAGYNWQRIVVIGPEIDEGDDTSELPETPEMQYYSADWTASPQSASGSFDLTYTVHVDKSANITHEKLDDAIFKLTPNPSSGTISGGTWTIGDPQIITTVDGAASATWTLHYEVTKTSTTTLSGKEGPYNTQEEANAAAEAAKNSAIAQLQNEAQAMVDAAIAEAKAQLAKITIDYGETSVPHGFDPTDSSSGSVSVPSNGSATAVVANQPWQAHVTWEKRDALTGGRITEDAEYVFYEWNVNANKYEISSNYRVTRLENGLYTVTVINPVYTDWTEGYVYYTQDNLGKFRIEEVTAPAGYTDAALQGTDWVEHWSQEFEITNSDQTYSYTGDDADYNRPQGNKVIIKKIEAHTGEIIVDDAVFTLYQWNQERGLYEKSKDYAFVRDAEGLYTITCLHDDWSQYAKVIASAIIGNTGSVNSGDSSEYFNETARGLITGLVLLVSQYGQDGERHIVSVFNLIVELAGADNPEKGNTVQKSRLAAMLEGVTDRRIKGYISTTTSADIRTTLNIVSSALSKLLKFVDAELEQLICTHDNDLDAEQFIERPTAIFLIAPDENETRHFLASLFVRFLTDDLIALAERQGGHCPRPFYYFLDEFGNFPAIPGVTSLFSAIRSRGGRILVAVQSYSQFLLKYDKNVTEIIKDNCQILLNTFVSPSAQDTATSISKMLGDETILTGSSSRSDGKTTSSHQLMGRPLMSPAQMVRIQRDTWIVEKAGYAPMKTHLEGYWKYLSLAPKEQDSTGENDYLEIKLLSTESLRQALGSAPARPHTPPAAKREPRRKLGASRREAAALYPGKFNP